MGLTINRVPYTVNRFNMCLAIPGKIKSIALQYGGLVRMAKVSFGGIIKEASLEMVPHAKEDDYVLVHVDVAISVVDEAEAKRNLSVFRRNGRSSRRIEYFGVFA